MRTKTRGTMTNQERCAGQFAAAVDEIRELAGKIHQAADDHLGVDPDHVNWAHVGDANRILQALRETLAIARNENH